MEPQADTPLHQRYHEAQVRRSFASFVRCMDKGVTEMDQTWCQQVLHSAKNWITKLTFLAYQSSSYIIGTAVASLFPDREIVPADELRLPQASKVVSETRVMRKILAISLGALGLLFALPSGAALMTEACGMPTGTAGDGDSSNDLTPSAQCLYAYDDTGKQLNDSEGALNTLSVFGESTWNLLGKQEEGDGAFSDSDDPNVINLNVEVTSLTVDPTAGTWEFDLTAWDSWNPIALVMKDGANATSPPQSEDNGFFIYLLSATDNSGFWNTLDTFDGAGLSHMSAYGVRDGVEIPAPGILGLMGIGILGLGAFARRRRIA